MTLKGDDKFCMGSYARWSCFCGVSGRRMAVSDEN